MLIKERSKCSNLPCPEVGYVGAKKPSKKQVHLSSDGHVTETKIANSKVNNDGQLQDYTILYSLSLMEHRDGWRVSLSVNSPMTLRDPNKIPTILTCKNFGAPYVKISGPLSWGDMLQKSFCAKYDEHVLPPKITKC